MSISRRDFLHAAAAGTALAAGLTTAQAAPRPKLKKAVKFSMINLQGSVLQKFELAKKVGFQGVEFDSPGGVDRVEAQLAQEATGVKIHGIVDSAHWAQPLSSPDAAVRAKGLAALKVALHDASLFGADTVLLVPGVVNKEVSYEQCYERSQAEVRKALPLAEKLQVKIAIETVWNDFITKPEQLIQYVDDFRSPWVGAYFDCSNMLKYGVPAAEWIRKLGKRMLKFDFKGYSLGKAKEANDPWAGFKVGIGEGDEKWPDVLDACAEVGYTSWATAEVGGGGEAVLRDISERMDRILELK